MEREVTINEDQQLYVIHGESGVTCWGFDVVLDRIKRMAIELAGRGVLPSEYIDVDDLDMLAEGDMAAVRELLPERGSMRAYDIMQILTAQLKSACETDRDRAVFDLSPQLMGLEGMRVEVVDKPGDKPRRFIVGKSTGWAPCHLEILRRTSHGGGPARREYHHVREIERVR
jgi:hypothetical protein